MLHNKEEIQKFVSGRDGWLLYEEGKFLYETARRLARKGEIVEVGSWKGKSTIWLACGVRDGGGKTVYAIDPHTGAPEHYVLFKTDKIWTFDEFKKNINEADVQDFVTPLVDRSENVARTWTSSISFMWIDGAHAYEAAKLDFDSWFPHVLIGGVIAYHDATYDGVLPLMREKIFSSHFKNIGIVGTICFATKINPQTKTFRDILQTLYARSIFELYALRKLPLPRWFRVRAKAVFNRIVRTTQ